MNSFIINGGNKLYGEIAVDGAKNGVLPILAATLLTDEECVIHNCPRLTDVEITKQILELLGCKVTSQGNTVTVDPVCADNTEIPEPLMRKMRSSIVFLGAISGRNGRAMMSSPGGCEIGSRPIDLHLYALRRLGINIAENGGKLICECGRPTGCEIVLSFPSVGATENIILAAAKAVGETVIVNAAREPEICDLAAVINKMGGKVRGAGDSTIIIEGVEKLHGFEHAVLPDRIAAATFLAAAAATGGKIRLSSIVPMHLIPIMCALEEMGCRISFDENSCQIERTGRLKPVKSIRTMPYPGFPTDAQAPLMAAACVADGTSVFIESIFDSRFKHVGELNRLGAKISTEGRVAVVEGVKRLSGAAVDSTDLRGGVALIIAGMTAEGVTTVRCTGHIDRGYDKIEEIFSSVGAKIRRIDTAADVADGYMSA